MPESQHLPAATKCGGEDTGSCLPGRLCSANDEHTGRTWVRLLLMRTVLGVSAAEMGPSGKAASAAAPPRSAGPSSWAWPWWLSDLRATKAERSCHSRCLWSLPGRRRPASWSGAAGPWRSYSSKSRHPRAPVLRRHFGPVPSGRGAILCAVANSGNKRPVRHACRRMSPRSFKNQYHNP